MAILRHSDTPLTITVDHPDRPSQDVDGQPGWLAVLEVNDGTGQIEAVSVAGPLRAVDVALGVLARRRYTAALREAETPIEITHDFTPGAYANAPQRDEHGEPY